MNTFLWYLASVLGTALAYFEAPVEVVTIFLLLIGVQSLSTRTYDVLLFLVGISMGIYMSQNLALNKDTLTVGTSLQHAALFTLLHITCGYVYSNIKHYSLFLQEVGAMLLGCSAIFYVFSISMGALVTSNTSYVGIIISLALILFIITSRALSVCYEETN